MITDYGELKTAVADWVNRDDLADKLPNFIAIAEKTIFRRLRIPENEAVYSETIDGNATVNVPADFLEAKNILVNGSPLEVVSDIYAYSYTNTSGSTRYVGRSGDLFLFRPLVVDGDIVTINYWQDQSGMSADTDTTEVLAEAPDLYLYATIMEIEKYLGSEGRIAQTKALFESKLNEIQQYAKSAELSGSTLQIKSAY